MAAGRPPLVPGPPPPRLMGGSSSRSRGRVVLSGIGVRGGLSQVVRIDAKSYSLGHLTAQLTARGLMRVGRSGVA